MYQSGVFLSQSALSSFSASTQAEIQQHLFDQADIIGVGPEPESDLATSFEEVDGPADLSAAQARKLVAGCSERPTKALRFVAEQPTTKFTYLDLLNSIGQDSSGTIRGTLAAITRRTRTVLGDPKADLIWFNEVEDERRWTCTVSDMTRASLRKVFVL